MSGARKLNIVIGISLLFVATFSNIFYILYPIKISGVNGFLIASSFLTLVLSLFLNVNLNARSASFSFAIVVVHIIFVICISLTVSEFRGVNFSLVSIRYLFTMMLYFCIFFPWCQLVEKQTVERFLIFQGIVFALLFVGNQILFPNIQYIMDASGNVEFVFDGTRSRNGIFGSSISANHSLLALFVVTSKNRAVKIGWLIESTIIIFLFIAIIYSSSRFPIFVAVVIIVFRGPLYFKMFAIIAFFASTLSGVSGDVLSGDFGAQINRVWGRVGQDSQRTQKAIIGLLAWSESLSTIMFGAHLDVLRKGLQGVTFSDNSILHIVYTHGVLVFASFGALFSYFVRKSWLATRETLPFIYALTALASSNTILWESWVINVVLYLAILGDERDGNTRLNRH